MTNLPPELASLPPPQVIDEISYETILASQIAILVSKMAAANVDYDVDALETDPAIIQMEVAAHADMLLRQRTNEAIRSNLLPFASNADLDILAQFYDVSRLDGESDAQLRRRVVLAIQGRSPGGTEARYKFITLSADARVADVAIYTIDKDPTIHAAVFAADNGGIADAALLSAVNAALQTSDVRMVNDIIVVASAAQVSIDVAAKLWLLPQTDAAILSDLEAQLRASWASTLGLGRDVTHSWLSAQLQQSGVQRVELTAPLSDVKMPFNQAAALGDIALEIAGRDF